MGYELEGQQWKIDEFRDYVNSIKDTLSWANSITMHHTASPDLNMRPNGFTKKHMQYLREYYQNELGWSAGPHLFIDDHQVSGMSGLFRRGVHAVAFNSNSIGIEMLGYYDKGGDDPFNGRGKKVLENGFQVARILLDAMGLDINEDTIHFHRDDPNTSKTCCGDAISKSWFVENVKNVSFGDDGDIDIPTESTPDIPNYSGVYVNRDGKWYAPIASFAKDVYNTDYKLTNESVFYVKGRRIEDTFYDQSQSATFGSINEMMNIS